MKERDLSVLENAVGHHFLRPELLEQALTHSSHARESEMQTGSEVGAAVRDNEQLEFLGDAVLGFITSQELFARFPSFSEGELSKTRAHLVSGKHLVRVAKELELGSYLRLGRGEERSGGRSKATLLVDSLEALLAAMFLDAGLDQVRDFVVRHIVDPELAQLQMEGGFPFTVTDFKSSLQEMAHATGRPQPSYVVINEEGPEHRKTFTVEARLHSSPKHGKIEYVGRAAGPTKKKAEQDAAKQALEYLWSLGEQESEPGKIRSRESK